MEENWVQIGESLCKLNEICANQGLVVQIFSNWCKSVKTGASLTKLYKLAQIPANWC